MKNIFFAWFVALFLTSYARAALEVNQELTKEELTRLEAKEFIVKTLEVPNSPWPVITYYALIDASPLISIGLFAAYDIQKDYVPNIIKSTPIKHVSPTDVHTSYELKIPFPLPNAHYVHGARIYQHGEDYEVVWYLVESTSAEEVKGSAYFKAYQEKTFFKYQSYVKPKSIFASLVKKMMFKDVEKSVKAIALFIEKTSKEKPELSHKYSEFITRALRGEFVYQSVIMGK